MNEAATIGDKKEADGSANYSTQRVRIVNFFGSPQPVGSGVRGM